MPLEKAKLIAVYKDEGKDIEFMFNPNQLAFSRSMSLEQAKGSSTGKGNNKVSFKHPNPYSLKISNILIDTYETKDATVIDIIKKFQLAVEFTKNGQGNAQEKRPPIYLFIWGNYNYLRCFVKTFSFKLTLFRPDGTPVRASVDLDLEQVDLPNSQPGQSTPSPNYVQRQSQGREAFSS
ncbi:MAG TPA: hypothetical protein V6D43_08420 [Candidatus Sericytochromatia bacterium]